MRAGPETRPAWRLLAHAGVIASGLVAIVGSGGGLGFPSLEMAPAPIPAAPTVRISPSEPTVQAGTIVEFRANVTNAGSAVSFQWRRSGVNIAGATGASYLLGGAQPGDDGAVFEVVVFAANGTASAHTVLHVSPLPPVVFEDTELPLAGWTFTGVGQPAQNGPAFSVAQAVDGGNPGAHRSVVYQMTPAPSSLRLVHLSEPSTYDPMSQGAIHTITLQLDCSLVPGSSTLGNASPRAHPAFEQGGRIYVPAAWNSSCGSWQTAASGSLTDAHFTIAEGTACGAAERCPDFSATASRLRFGIQTRLSLDGASPGGSLTQGLDNWKVNVWRK